jgi:hypothetical protein
MAAIYQADIWCDSCADAIRSDLKATVGDTGFPFNPGDERTYDSDEYPKYAWDHDETDSPQHCGSGKDCLEAETLSDGSKVGMLIGTHLTDEGVDYLKEAIVCGGTVAEFWAEAFKDYL